MIVRLGTAPRRAGLSFTGFQQHWRTSHADVVSHLPGLRRYQQFHAVLGGGEPLLPYPGFDACSALRFDDVDAMDAAFSSDAFLRSVQADEEEFVDKTFFRGVVGTWRPDADEDLGAADLVQVLTLLEEDGVAPDDLAARLAGVGGGSSAGSIVADHRLHEGRFPVTADVVRVVAYDDVPAARAGAEAVRRAAGTARVVAQHLARVVDVPVGDGTPGQQQERTSA